MANAPPPGQDRPHAAGGAGKAGACIQEARRPGGGPLPSHLAASDHGVDILCNEQGMRDTHKTHQRHSSTHPGPPHEARPGGRARHAASPVPSGTARTRLPPILETRPGLRPAPGDAHTGTSGFASRWAAACSPTRSSRDPGLKIKEQVLPGLPWWPRGEEPLAKQETRVPALGWEDIRCPRAAKRAPLEPVVHSKRSRCNRRPGQQQRPSTAKITHKAAKQRSGHN